jgi:hypothetical protein
MPAQLELKTAEDVVSYLATEVLGPGWAMTFGLANTNLSAEVPDVKRPPDPAWRMCWGGLFDEAQRGDVEPLLDRILKHTVAIEDIGRTDVPTEAVPAWLPTVTARQSPTGNMSLLVCSKVCRSEDGRVRHIPMMDFRCEPSEASLRLVSSSMRRLGQSRGVVLESGRSYHFYGFELMTESEWLEFMYRSLLLTPFTDPRYIGHRLLGGTARLRVTSSQGKPVTPNVVDRLG